MGTRAAEACGDRQAILAPASRSGRPQPGPVRDPLAAPHRVSWLIEGSDGRAQPVGQAVRRNDAPARASDGPVAGRMNARTVSGVPLHRYEARIAWTRDGARFTDNRYSREHEWTFDGGVQVRASASPAVVPLPYSVADAVDPEEALVASASSCHMLWFLSLAAKRAFVVDSYVDDAFGVLERDAGGKLFFARITLRPKARFSGTAPTPEQLESLHHAAHAECFIARSLKSEIVVEPEPARSTP